MHCPYWTIAIENFHVNLGLSTESEILSFDLLFLYWVIPEKNHHSLPPSPRRRMGTFFNPLLSRFPKPLTRNPSVGEVWIFFWSNPFLFSPLSSCHVVKKICVFRLFSRELSRHWLKFFFYPLFSGTTNKHHKFGIFLRLPNVQL